MSRFAFDHWPVSLALVLPFLTAAAACGLWGWWRERRAVASVIDELTR